MSTVAKKGPPGLGESYAALALVRSLLRHLESSRTLATKEVTAILADALSQIPSENDEARSEARRLIEELRVP